MHPPKPLDPKSHVNKMFPPSSPTPNPCQQNAPLDKPLDPKSNVSKMGSVWNTLRKDCWKLLRHCLNILDIKLFDNICYSIFWSHLLRNGPTTLVTKQSDHICYKIIWSHLLRNRLIASVTQFIRQQNAPLTKPLDPKSHVKKIMSVRKTLREDCWKLTRNCQNVFDTNLSDNICYEIVWSHLPCTAARSTSLVGALCN